MNKILLFVKVVLSVNMLMLLVWANSNHASAQICAKEDTVSMSLQFNLLNRQRADLESRIKLEDKKRQRRIQGVSVNTQESMNVAQDSVCLELRSELVEVNLRISELTPNFTSGQLQHVFDRIRQRHSKDSISANPTLQNNRRK